MRTVFYINKNDVPKITGPKPAVTAGRIGMRTIAVEQRGGVGSGRAGLFRSARIDLFEIKQVLQRYAERICNFYKRDEARRPFVFDGPVHRGLHNLIFFAELIDGCIACILNPAAD